MGRIKGVILRSSGAALSAWIGLVLPVFIGRARADTGPCDAPQGPAQYPDKFDWNGSYLFGDLYGVRSKGQQAGITLCSQYNAYVYDNAQGGLKQGPLAQGQLFSWIEIDLGKFTHIDDLNDTFMHAALYSMQGRPITLREVGSFSTISFAEQITTNRIGTAWLERRFLDGKLSIRGGQLGIDDEFMVTPTANSFIDATFGFPGWLGIVLPGGGAAYPLQGPGLRAKYSPSEAITVMAGAYTGDPAGRSNPVPQLADRFGTTFNLSAGTLWIAEAAYSTAYPSSGVVCKAPTSLVLGSSWRTDLMIFTSTTAGDRLRARIPRGSRSDIAMISASMVSSTRAFYRETRMDPTSSPRSCALVQIRAIAM